MIFFHMCLILLKSGIPGFTEMLKISTCTCLEQVIPLYVEALVSVC